MSASSAAIPNGGVQPQTDQALDLDLTSVWMLLLSLIKKNDGIALYEKLAEVRVWLYQLNSFCLGSPSHYKILTINWFIAAERKG